MGNSLLTAGLVRRAHEAELTFLFRCFVPPRLHLCLPTSTHLSFHVHPLSYNHLCVTMFTSVVHEVHTCVLLRPHLCLTTSTSLSDHVHNFALPYPAFGSLRPHMCHIMSTPLAHHVHTCHIISTPLAHHVHTCVISCPHLWLTTSTHVSYHAHTFGSPRPRMCHIMSAPLAHHVHKCVICPHLCLTTSTHVSYHVHTFFIVVLISSVQVQSS